MTAQSSWQGLLTAPRPCDHLVQLYTDDDFLARAVTRFVSVGLAAGEGAVLIATPAHSALFVERLAGAHDAMARGCLVVVDAVGCLRKFMVDGMPDRAGFMHVATEVVDRVRGAGYSKVRLYGEMVDLLWEDAFDAAVRLEEMWNEFLATNGLCLLCAYRIDNFDRYTHRGVMAQISATHSHLIPVEDYPRFDRAVERAYTDVFGAENDAQKLRVLLAEALAPPTVMPRAQAALLALREINDHTADAVLELARRYYEEDAVSVPA